MDILRGVAALVVVAYHYSHFYYTDLFQADLYVNVPFATILAPLYSDGQWFVEMFFSISGYVFFWLYREPIMAGAVSFKTFAIARLARLYPLYLLTLAMTVILGGLFVYLYRYNFVYQNQTLLNFLLNTLMIQQWAPLATLSFNGPAWSISIEILLYIAFFLFCRFRLGRASALLIVLLSTALLIWQPDVFLFRGPPSFFLGGLAWYVVEAIRAQPNMLVLRRTILVIVGLGWGGSYIFNHDALAFDNRLSGVIDFLFSKDKFVLILVPLTLVAVGLWRGVMAEKRLKPFVWLGDISYSTYLIHFPLQMLIMMGLNQLTTATKASVIASPLFFLSFFLTLVGLSILSYRFFEMPTRIAILKRFSPRFRHSA